MWPKSSTLYVFSLKKISCISRVCATQYQCLVLKQKICMPRASPGFCRHRIPSIIKCEKRLTSRTLESRRAQWQTVGWPRHRDPCHHLHMRCPLFSLTCQTLSSCAQSICILLRSANCNWFPTMLPRHTHSTRPAALSYGGAREVAQPSDVVVSWEVAVLLIHRLVKDNYNFALFF